MDASVDGIVRWDVRSDQIDPGRWAKAILKALGAGDRDGPKPVPPWTGWAIIVLAIALLLAVGPSTLAPIVIPLVVVVGFILILKATSERRLAKHLASVPGMREGFTFQADASGTLQEGPSAAGRVLWSRYRAARLDDDVITLLLDNRTVQVLPVAALQGHEPPEAVVARLDRWIAGSQPQP